MAVVDVLPRALEKKIRTLRRRKGRREEGLCLCEGVRACGEVLSRRPELVAFGVFREDFRPDGFDGARFYAAPASRFDQLCPTVSPSGVLLVVRVPEPPSPTRPPTDPFLLVLDKLADPGNLGTIFRAALAAGLQEIWLTEGTVDPYSEKTIRAALAAQFALSVRTFASLDAVAEGLRAFDYPRWYRAEPAAGKNCFAEPALFERSAIVFGNEAFGAGEMTGATALNIPMPGRAESLNVAQAATIVLFEAVRRGVFDR